MQGRYDGSHLALSRADSITPRPKAVRSLSFFCSACVRLFTGRAIRRRRIAFNGVAAAERAEEARCARDDVTARSRS